MVKRGAIVVNKDSPRLTRGQIALIAMVASAQNKKSGGKLTLVLVIGTLHSVSETRLSRRQQDAAVCFQHIYGCSTN